MNIETNQIKDNALDVLINWEKYKIINLSKLEKLNLFILRTFGKLPRRKYEICWRRGLLAKSILSVSNDKNDVEAVLHYFSIYRQKKGTVSQLENIYNGEALLELYSRGFKQETEGIIEEYSRYLECRNKDIQGSISYFNDNNDILVDGLMCCPFIFRYQRDFRPNKNLLSIGVSQISNFINNGLDFKTKLPYHAYNIEDGLQKGIFGWGRGVGWFLSSIAISLAYMDDEISCFEEIKRCFQSVAMEVLSYQKKDGLYNWCLLMQNGPIDTSATCMILFSIAKGINIGILDNTLKERVIIGYKSLDIYISNGHLGQAMADCAGISMYPQNRYGSYPWSDGFYLLLCSEIRCF